MRLIITALAFIFFVLFSIADVSANHPYDFGVSIVELSDSTTADNFENKKLELKAELKKKNGKAFVSAVISEALLLGSIGVFLLLDDSSSGSSNSQPWVAVDYDLGNLIVAIVVGLGGSVLIVAKLITTLVKNKADYKRSLKEL